MRAPTVNRYLAIAALSTALSTGSLWAGPSVTQAGPPSNFGTVTLRQASDSLPTMPPGHTGGSYSLAALVNRDRDNNTCLGYGDSRPDYLLVLPKALDQLQLRVDSGGADTTLIVEGPDGFRCADDGPALSLGAPASADAQLSATQWKAGTYRIWIGTMAPADRRSYQLILSQ